MKYIILLSDGMAGEPLKELGNKTTMEAAKKPFMDELAGKAEVGMAHMVPIGMEPGSDTANLAVLGYDPKKYYTGRSPLEALSIGADMEPGDISLRMNLVTVSEEESFKERTMIDHSAGEITTEEADILVTDLKKKLEKSGYEFYTGTSYRHLVIVKDGKITKLTPPHDILGKRVGDFLPEDETLRNMIFDAAKILEEHPVNVERKKRGERAANSIWFWGPGTKPALSDFYKRTGKRGVMISAVDLLKGIAVGAGMDIINVPGANGGLHTNYEGKAEAATKALTQDGYDFAYIHVEAPDEMGHQGLAKEKIQAIENIDGRVLGPLLSGLNEKKEDYRIMILPDHPTPITVRTHTSDAVPFLIYDSTNMQKGTQNFSEKEAGKTGLYVRDGYTLIQTLLK